jgi:hypothetical protein
MRQAARFAILIYLACAALHAQTTQGLISGRILNSVTGKPVAGADVSYNSATLAAGGTVKTDAAGYFFLPLLSAGTYTIRALAGTYQAQELQQLELAVAGRIQVDFRLRPLSDVWESGSYRSVFLPGSKTIVTFYGPDVDTSRSGSFEAQKGERGTLDTSVSYVIDPVQIGDLPLLGRDVYEMLVTLPGVGADSATGRGLGVSVAGQRPSSSNYLLDGVENDNYLITGPLSPTPPEAIQEYRISTNNYSAEYGRTAGFIANAVTRAGGAQYHGIVYEYLKNTGLDAADFQDNLHGYGRLPDKENEFGYQAGGPVIPKGSLRTRLFFSSSLDQLISHSQQNPKTFQLPSTNFLSAFNVPSTRLAAQLLEEYPGPVVNTKAVTGSYTVSPPVVVDRTIGLERGDYVTKSGRDHFMARLALARTSEPDFNWTPYRAFISGLHEVTTGIATNWQHTWTPRMTSEFKVSYTDDNLWWDRAHPEIPTLVSEDGTTLPGSPAFYAYRNHNRTPEFIYSTVWTRNRHVITAGVGLLFRFDSGYLTAGQDSEYLFSGIYAFSQDQPNTFYTAVNALSPTPAQLNYNRDYRYAQSYFFVQDSFRVSPRFTLNYGLRYERFGAPENTGAVKDALVVLGAGTDFTSRLASAALTLPGAENEQLYGADNKDFAPRFGFSWDPFGKSKTVLRGGFGIFYDRPFDNLWQTVSSNEVGLQMFSLTAGSTNYLQSAATAIGQYKGGTPYQFTGLTLMDPKLRNGYTESSFLGVQQTVGDNVTIEVNGTSGLGRRLITTDIVNRYYTIPNGGRPNDSLPDVYWRSSQGQSDYYALSTLVRYRLRSLQLQAAYTWSHSIDNQSDPLTGEFLSLNFTSITGGGGNTLLSSFEQQYNSSGDRGNSDFDQRHNLVLIGTWQPQSSRLLTRGWRFSWLAAFRTGTPYTVLSPNYEMPDSGGEPENLRASVAGSGAVLASPVAVPGGVQLLNAAAFSIPEGDWPGNTGRNEFRGPGLYSIDTSIARSFSIPRLREGTKFTVRADFFNVLNHANLGNPDNFLGDPNFGVSTYGRQGVTSGFPASTPLNETARQAQILLRAEF